MDHDLMVHCHWEYDLRTAIQIADAVEADQTRVARGPVAGRLPDSWKRLCAASKVPICMGENLARREGFKDFILNQGCDILHPDLRRRRVSRDEAHRGLGPRVRPADGQSQYRQPGLHLCVRAVGGIDPRLRRARDDYRRGRLDGSGPFARRPYIKDGCIHVTDKPRTRHRAEP